MSQKDSFYPEMRNVDPSVRDAIRLLYDAVYALVGRRGPIYLEDVVRASSQVLAFNTTDPAANELVTRAYADAHYSPPVIANELKSSGSSPLNLTALPGYATARFEYGGTAVRPTRGAADGQIFNDTTTGVVYRWNENTQTWDTISGTGTHNLLDGVIHPDTTASTVVAGDVVYGNATPKWTRLAKGSNGQVLTLAAGLPSWATPAVSGWTDDGTVVRLTTITDQVGVQTITPGSGDSMTVQGVLRVRNSSQPYLKIDRTGAAGWKAAILFTDDDVAKFEAGIDILDGGTNQLYWYDSAASALRMTLDSTALQVYPHLTVGGGTSASELRFLEPSGGGTAYTGFKAPALAASVVYTLPTADAAASGYALTSNASGTLSWSSITSSPWTENAGNNDVYVTTTGRQVIIGATTSYDATVKLDVRGIVYADRGGTTSPGYAFQTSAGDTTAGIGLASEGTGGEKSLSFIVDNAAPRGTIMRAADSTNNSVFRLKSAFTTASALNEIWSMDSNSPEETAPLYIRADSLHLVTTSAFIELAGTTAPSAPADGAVRLYVDQSGGKDRLMGLFNTGAAQQIIIEP